MRGALIEKYSTNGTGFKPEGSNSWLERYKSVRRYSEYICEPLAIEDYVVQPTDDVSPPKWHLAHTTWFFEEFILSNHYQHYRKFHPRFSYLFNSYYDGIGNRVQKPDRGNYSRPTVEEIFEYRAYVDEHMSYLLQDFPKDAYRLLDIGLNHEQQHQELLYADIKYILGNNPLAPAYKKDFRETTDVVSGNSMITVPEGHYTIGYTGRGFSYDNEHNAHTVLLKAFDIRESLVTNGEYFQFMLAGGYQRHDYWLSDGWKWIKENRIKSPMYWQFMDGKWCRYSLAGLEQINPDEPVTHVSFYEASAFAQWRGMRLPTEFEWEAASARLQWGLRWEHTSSAYLPYPGYQKPDGVVGEYNGKFMINNMVMRGASVVTPENHSRPSYRNFFNPHQRWQFTGIRLCHM